MVKKNIFKPYVKFTGKSCIYTIGTENFVFGVMNILALDLGTKTGWAMMQNFAVTSDTTTASGSLCFVTNRTAGYGIRFLNFHNWLVGMFQKYKIDLVVFEDVKNHVGVYAAHAYGGFLAGLTAVCEENNVSYQGFGVKTIKKFITGNGNANKQDVIDAIHTKGYKPVDDNEADALALLLLAESELVKEGRVMNRTNKTKYKSNYNANIKSGVRDTGESIDRHNLNYRKVFMGPFKYSQVTGKLTAASR